MSALPQAVLDVLAERERQRAKWSPEHDQEHDDCALAAAAVHLACPAHSAIWEEEGDAVPPDTGSTFAVFRVPAPGWARELKLKHPQRRPRLIVAAALLLAEIEREDGRQNPHSRLPDDDRRARDERRALALARALPLKTWPKGFNAVLDGTKSYEIRSTKDRTFVVGDILLLREWVPAHEGACVFVEGSEAETLAAFEHCAPCSGGPRCRAERYCVRDLPLPHYPCSTCGRKASEPLLGEYTDRALLVEVTYITPGGAWGLPDDVCVMSIRKIA